MMHRTTALFALALLAACSGGEKQQGAGKAEGEILPGSASDAMLPADTVRSQAPLAPHAEGSGKARGEAATEGPDEAAASEASPEAPAPEAAEPPEAE
jgi:hypothetical protein